MVEKTSPGTRSAARPSREIVSRDGTAVVVAKLNQPRAVPSTDRHSAGPQFITLIATYATRSRNKGTEQLPQTENAADVATPVKTNLAGEAAKTDVLSLLETIRHHRQVAKKIAPYTQRASKLERHRSAILKLSESGASLGEIQFYLQVIASPKIEASRSTIKRFVDRLNEPSDV